jgi:4-hydroxybenzoate polyprenyltransferase
MRIRRFLEHEVSANIESRGTCGGEKEALMLLTVGIVLFVLWALGLFAFHVTSSFIHVLVVLAVIAIVMHLVRGDRIAA